MSESPLGRSTSLLNFAFIRPRRSLAAIATPPVNFVPILPRAASGVGQTKSYAQDWGCQAFRKGMKGTRSRRVTRGSSSLIAILKCSVASCAAHPASLT
jgi:hypothetical protein